MNRDRRERGERRGARNEIHGAEEVKEKWNEKKERIPVGWLLARSVGWRERQRRIDGKTEDSKGKEKSTRVNARMIEKEESKKIWDEGGGEE